MKKTIKKIINIILNILITLIVMIAILLIYSTVQTSVRKQEYPNLFGYTYFKVVTGSMGDTIDIGDVIIVKIKDDKTYLKENQIIVYKQENNMITHRIIAIDGNEIITKGDANNAADEQITCKDVIGTVVKIIPDVGIWQEVLMNPEVFLSILTTVILFGLAFAIDDKKDKIKVTIDKKKEDNNND